MPSIGSSVGEGRGRAQRARVWGWVRVRSQMCEFPRPEQACNCSTSPIYTHTDTPQRVRGWWGRGSQFMGRGFRPASLESGLFLEGAPRRLHCVTFAPTSQFSPYLHTRDSTQIHHSEYEVGGRGGVHSLWDGVSTCVPGVRVVPSGDPPPTSLCNLRSHQPILPLYTHTRQYTDTPQRVRGWWEKGGSQFMGRGFDLRPWSQGCSFRGPPADFTV